MLYRPIGQRAAEQVVRGSPVHKALNDALAAKQSAPGPVRFAPQQAALGAADYELSIFQTRCVPTRHNLHDFFNGLVWLHLPATKQKLNALQAAEITAQRDAPRQSQAAGTGAAPAHQTMTSHRGRLRDALTLFDENAALLLEPSPRLPLLQALRHKAWQDAFIEQRALWDSAQVLIVGHALLEKLVSPRKAMTAHVYCPQPPLRHAGLEHTGALSLDELAQIDASLAAQLNPEYLRRMPFAHLPVLGVPAWCPDNHDVAFYDDASVFRPLRPGLPSIRAAS